MEESEISLEQIEESRRRLSQRPFIRVVCNEQVGHLYMNLFHCPGGHVPCIEYCGHMVSPEAFCASANNGTDPNDWKDSIRIGRRNLRWLMRHSILDFHDHKQSCTNLCLSHKEIVTEPVKRIAHLPPLMLPVIFVPNMIHMPQTLTIPSISLDTAVKGMNPTTINHEPLDDHKQDVTNYNLPPMTYYTHVQPPMMPLMTFPPILPPYVWKPVYSEKTEIEQPVTVIQVEPEKKQIDSSKIDTVEENQELINEKSTLRIVEQKESSLIWDRINPDQTAPTVANSVLMVTHNARKRRLAQTPPPPLTVTGSEMIQTDTSIVEEKRRIMHGYMHMARSRMAVNNWFQNIIGGSSQVQETQNEIGNMSTIMNYYPEKRKWNMETWFNSSMTKQVQSLGNMMKPVSSYTQINYVQACEELDKRTK